MADKKLGKDFSSIPVAIERALLLPFFAESRLATEPSIKVLSRRTPRLNTIIRPSTPRSSRSWSQLSRLHRLRRTVLCYVHEWRPKRKALEATFPQSRSVAENLHRLS